MKTIKMINQNEAQEEQEVQPKTIPNLKIKEYELVQVPTGNTIAIQTPDGEIMDTNFAMVEILNKLNKLEKAWIGS